MNWYQVEISKAFSLAGTGTGGLTSEQVRQKLEEFGYNEFEVKKKKPVWKLFLNQFNDFTILVLIAAAVLSGFIGEAADSIIILLIVFINAIVGFEQEYHADKTMEALKQMASPQAMVIRSGHINVLPGKELVPGDLVILEEGNTVPADMRLTETEALKIMESSLTGESEAVDKMTDTLPSDSLLPYDQLNMAFKGTQVSFGRGKGIVTATGMNTEIGRIARLLEEDDGLTPLQKRMSDFGKKLSYIIIFICSVLFLVGLLRGEEPMNMLLVAISLAVAAIPEALPALITIALSRGAKKLVKKNVLIRKLTAVETLGSTTYICTDKTGTLTENKMKVVDVIENAGHRIDQATVSFLQTAMALSNSVRIDEEKLIGDPTEVALVENVIANNSIATIAELKELFPKIGELPFDCHRKSMSTIHRYGESIIVFTKGSVETIIEHLRIGEDRSGVAMQANSIAAQGKRVIAFAFKVIDELKKPYLIENVESGLSYLGMVGIFDPPRGEVKEAINECKHAGIQPVMITGDHKETALAIAKEIGLIGRDDGLVVTGKELNDYTEEDWLSKVEKIKIYARVSPEQKLEIVKALQKRGHFVAMTGDGVNDAPALKKADIGVAMGITGTDVSKEAADMILLDDNFATIIKAVKEGRRIYDNIRRFVKYIMTCNSAEIWTLFLAPLLALPIPLLPIHILWINLVTDGLPGLALSAERAETNVMLRPPRKTTESLFAEGIAFHIVWVGILMAALTLGMQAWALHTGNPHWQTMVFTVLSVSQLAHVFAIRSDNEFIFRKGIFSNLPLLYAVVITFILQMIVIYLPFANRLFKTSPLSLGELIVCIIVSAFIFHAVEFEKYFKARFIKQPVRH